jgi:hypothetical protein
MGEFAGRIYKSTFFPDGDGHQDGVFRDGDNPDADLIIKLNEWQMFSIHHGDEDLDISDIKFYKNKYQMFDPFGIITPLKQFKIRNHSFIFEIEDNVFLYNESSFNGAPELVMTSRLPNCGDYRAFFISFWTHMHKGELDEVFLRQYRELPAANQQMFVNLHNSRPFTVQYNLQNLIQEAITHETIIPNKTYYVLNYVPAAAESDYFRLTVLTKYSFMSLISSNLQATDPLTRLPIKSVLKVQFLPRPFVGQIKRTREEDLNKRRSELRRTESFGGGYL